MDTDWLRVFDHEISRRRRILHENPNLYIKIHSANPKGLLSSDECNEHCWVPATHLMIHDNGTKSYKIAGLNRRGFREASTYKEGTTSIVPQMCWKCDATRDYRIEVIPAEVRKAALKALRPRKTRGRRTEPAKSIFNELFE